MSQLEISEDDDKVEEPISYNFTATHDVNYFLS